MPSPLRRCDRISACICARPNIHIPGCVFGFSTRVLFSCTAFIIRTHLIDRYYNVIIINKYNNTVVVGNFERLMFFTAFARATDFSF